MTMAEREYIERGAIEKFIQDGLNNPDISKAFGHDAVEILAEIYSTPTADVVEVRYGTWILNSDGSGTCSECRFAQKNVWDYDNCQGFCGVCGAKMDGGAK